MTKNRFTAFAVITGILVFTIISRFTYLAFFFEKKPAPVRNSQAVTERGPILDRNGRILAVQSQLYSVTAWMPNVANKDETCRSLLQNCPLITVTLGQIRNKKRFLYIKRKVSSKEADKIRSLKTGKLTGISLEPDFGRSYPEKLLPHMYLVLWEQTIQALKE